MGRLSRMMAVLAVSTVVAMLSALPATALAQSFSEFHRFIGTATLDGTLVPVGADITAFDGTRSIGTVKATSGGQFALQTTQAFGTIVFKINRVTTDQTFANWRPKRRIHRLPPYGHHSGGPDAGHGRGSGAAGTCGSGRACWSPGRAGSARPGG